MRSYSTAGFERCELTVGGVRTVGYVGGSGPDVVYLHGGGTFHGFEFAREWLPQFRVLLPYHPGFGESDDAPALHTIEDYVRHCRALFDALGLRRIHLVGASLGGRLAAQYAITHPEQLRRLVLVAPAGITLPEFPMPDFSRIAHHDRPRYFVHDPSVIERHWLSDPDQAFLAARAREAQTVGRLLADSAAFADSLDRVKSPTLIAWGSEDRMLPAGNARAWQAAIAGSTVKIFERAGHLLLDESAAARAAVAQFLSESTPQNNAA